MKKYFYIVLLSIFFVSILLVVRPKTPPVVINQIDLTTLPPEISPSKSQTYTNPKYFYKFSCPSGSTRAIESSDSLFQETCFQNNNQIRIYVHTISFYDKLKNDPSIILQNYTESNLSGFKEISYIAKNEADYFEIFLGPTRIISLRGYDKTYFDFVKNSLTIVNFPTPTPQIIPNITILDAKDWFPQTCQNLSFKVPPRYSVTCNPNSSINISNKEQSALILLKKYNGGSRRQYWIDQLNLTPQDVIQKTKIDENNFGNIAGLDFFVDGHQSPILINSGNTIIIILGGRSYDSKTNQVTRWDITDTIASTIKLND